MATATVEVTLPGLTGYTLSLKLYTYKTDTLVHTISLTEATNRKCTYTGTQVTPTAGLYQAIALEGSTVRGEGYVYVADAAAVHVVQGSPADALMGTPAGDSMSADIAAIKGDTGNLVTRITAALFAGITSLADWLGLLAGKTADASTLAELNATTAGVGFTNLTDSLQAIRDNQSVSGSGGSVITVTVDDGTDPLQGATVRLSEGINNYDSDTGADGIVSPLFGVSDATYTVTITKDGYSFTPTTLVVSGSASATYSMTLNVISVPADPTLATLVVKCVDEEGAVEADVSIHCKMSAIPASGTGIAYDGTTQTATSDASGNAYLTVVRSATYLVKRGTENVWKSVTIADAASTTVTSFIGSP